MNTFVTLFTIFAIIKTLSYGIFEIKSNNKIAGYLVIALGIFGFIYSNYAVWFIY